MPRLGWTLYFSFAGILPIALRGFDLIDRIPAGPFSVSLGNVSGILSTLSLAIIILLRSSSMSRRQALLAAELAAAQQVQQVLLPDQIETVAGFTIDAAYQPAQQSRRRRLSSAPELMRRLWLLVEDAGRDCRR